MNPSEIGTRLARVQRAFSVLATLLAAFSRLVAVLTRRIK